MNTKKENHRTTVRNLVIFTMVILASGWIGRELDILMGNQASESLGMLIWLVTPLGTALLLRTFGGDGWKDFGIKPNFKGNILGYFIALIVFPVVIVLVLMIGNGLKMITFPNLSLNSLVLILNTFVLCLLPQFIKNFFEESAWRGYLTPRFAALRLNDFTNHLIVGLVWGSWHIPYYLLFLDRSYLQHFTALNLAVFIPLVIAMMVSWAIVFGEIRLLTNSIWPAVLMHMVEDSLLNQLITERHISIVPGTDWLVSPVNGLIGILLFVLIGVGLHRLRVRRQLVIQSSE